MTQQTTTATGNTSASTAAATGTAAGASGAALPTTPIAHYDVTKNIPVLRNFIRVILDVYETGIGDDTNGPILAAKGSLLIGSRTASTLNLDPLNNASPAQNFQVTHLVVPLPNIPIPIPIDLDVEVGCVDYTWHPASGPGASNGSAPKGVQLARGRVTCNIRARLSIDRMIKAAPVLFPLDIEVERQPIPPGGAGGGKQTLMGEFVVDGAGGLATNIESYMLAKAHLLQEQR